jgi:hypothetical protein
MKAVINRYDLHMASPTHTYFCLHVDKDFDDEIESEDNTPKPQNPYCFM